MRCERLTLVGTGIFEQDDLALFEIQTGLLCEEEVGTLDDVAEVRFSFRVNKSSDVGDVDSLGTTNKIRRPTWEERRK